MTRLYHKALALGAAAAILTASSAIAGPIGPAGTQVKQAVPSAITDVRIRRGTGAAIAAGAVIGLSAAAIAANSYNYGYGYGYGEPYGYGYAEPYDGPYGPYDSGYAPAYGYGYGYTGRCENQPSPERGNAC